MTESQDTEAPASLIGLELEVLDKRDELEQEKLGDASSTDTRLVRSDSEDADLSMLGIDGEHVVLGASGNYPFPKGDGVIQPYNVNPFLNEAACMVQEWFRCCVVAFTIFPLRLAVLLLSLVVGFLTVSIAGLGFEKNSYNPARGVAWIRKEVLLKPIRLCARGVLFAFGFWWIEQLKEEDDDQEGEAAPVMVVASHSSLFDMLYFVYGWQPMFICDAAMKDVPVLGRCAYLMDAIFVDR